MARVVMNWRYQKVHPSFLIASVSVGILIGTALSPLVPIFQIEFLLLAMIILAVVFARQRVLMIALALVAGGLVGLWRGGVDIAKISGIAKFYDQKVLLTGQVAEDVSVGRRKESQIRLKKVKINGQKVTGQFWVTTQSKLKMKRSDHIAAKGKLKRGFGNFNGSMVFASVLRVERIKGDDIAREVRDWFGDHVRKFVKEPEVSLGIGYLTGQRRTLPEKLDDQLRIVGLTHVVVASGYNLTILVRFARRLFMRYSKYWATVSASTMIFSFVLVTGLSPSMSRAALVTGLSLAAWYYGRKIHPMVILPFSAAVTVLVNPSYIWGEVISAGRYHSYRLLE